MLKEFRDFISRGNVLDLAVGVVMGSAFSAIVTSLVDDIIMPFVGLIIGGIDFTNMALKINNVSINYGNFIQVLIDFLIIGVSIFFVIKGINKLRKKKEEEPTPEPIAEPTKEEKLLTEIRDLLKRG